jgi:FecR protein
MVISGGFGRVLTLALALGAGSSAFAADDGAWLVKKSSGEVSMTTTGAQQASLKPEDTLKPGDTIRTGRNGRVLLVRGEETILVSPNSVIGLPTEKKDGLSTTILQQAGSILLEVEKRNVKHFEVETPYLAAVVKGTQFRVSVNAASTSVDVLRGQVEVADFKSGQIAQVMPGQVATVFAHGRSGLSLSGSGTFNPIEQGKPRPSSIERIMVPKGGLSAQRSATNGQSGNARIRPGVTRISASLGEVRLNFHKVTHGLAHGSASTSGATRNAADKDTVWNSQAKATGPVNGSSQGNSSDTGGSAATAAGAINSAVTGQVAAVTAAANNGNGNGNANGNGNGNNGNGNGNNGNGNPGNGNGHGHGHH